MDNKTNKQWVIKQINLKFLLKTQMTRLKLSYFGHIVQISNSLEKVLLLGKVEEREGQQQE